MGLRFRVIDKGADVVLNIEDPATGRGIEATLGYAAAFQLAVRLTKAATSARLCHELGRRLARAALEGSE